MKAIVEKLLSVRRAKRKTLVDIGFCRTRLFVAQSDVKLFEEALANKTAHLVKLEAFESDYRLRLLTCGWSHRRALRLVKTIETGGVNDVRN